MPSSVIRYFAYDDARRELRIRFQSGRRYIYLDVPPEVFDRMKASFSKGEFFNQHIRDHFRFAREPESES
jgi:hypothetical protein